MVHVIKNDSSLTPLPALEINSKLTPFDWRNALWLLHVDYQKTVA